MTLTMLAVPTGSILEQFRRAAKTSNQGVSARRVPQLPQKTSEERSCFPQFAQTRLRAAGARAAVPGAGGWMGLPQREQNFSFGSEPLPQLEQAQPVRMNLANRAPIPSGPGPAAEAGADAGAGDGAAGGAGATGGAGAAGYCGTGGRCAVGAAGACVGTAFLACARDWS